MLQIRAKRQIHEPMSVAAVRFTEGDSALGIKVVQLSLGREDAPTIGANVQARRITRHPSGFKSRPRGEQRCLVFGDHRQRKNFGLTSIRRAQ